MSDRTTYRHCSQAKLHWCKFGGRGSVWFHDIAHTCLGTSFTPRSRRVGDVGGEAAGHGGEGARATQGRSGQGLGGVPAVGPRAGQTVRRRGGSGAGTPSRRPLRSPHQVSPQLEDEIVELRKALSEQGLDAGAHTIAFHLTNRRGGSAPAVSTIWRVLSRRGFVIPQPQKRPRSSFIRFRPRCPTSGGRPT